MNGFMKIKILIVISILIFLASCQRVDVVTETMSVDGGEDIEFEIKKEWKMGSGGKVLWEFGDGSVSTERNPVYAYSSGGNYLVTLSTYTNSGRLKNKITPYAIKVSQLYKPRVKGLSAETESLDYVYANLDTYLYTLVSQEVEDNIYDYTFKMIIDYNDTLIGRGNTYVFSDTGNHDVQVKIFDENGVSGTLDTIMGVGGATSYIRFRLNNANLAPLGSITERYLIVYRNTSSTYYSGDKQDFLDYPGPGVTNSLINNGELMSYYGPGYSDYFYWTFDPFGYIVLPSVNDGDLYQINVQANDGSFIDYDNLRAFHLVVGTNGINLSELPIMIRPGLTTEVFDLPTPTFHPY